MLLPLLLAATPGRPDPPTPREPEAERSPEEIEPPTEPPAEPEPERLPPGEPFQEPEPDIPDGPGVADPDLAPGAPLSPPAPSPEGPPSEGPPPEEPDDTNGYVSDYDAPFDAASLPPDHPAYDRVQARPSNARGRALPLVVGVLLIVVGLLATYLILRPEPEPGAVPDLLSLAAAHADAVQVDVATSDLDEAEAYIMTEFGWPIRVPVLPDARLAGVGVDALTEGVEVPVLVYQPDDEARAPITVYAYDYAFLDAAADYLRLAPAVYARLADDPPVDVRRVGDLYLVLWRRRAAIYTAATRDDPAPLVEYLSRR